MSSALPTEQAGTIVLRDGIVVYASEGCSALAGRPVGEIVGRPFVDFIVPEQRAAARDRYARRMRGEPVAPTQELTLEQPGGGRCHVEIHAVRDGRDILVHLRDLSVRDARRLRLDAVAALGAALQRELDEDAVHARVRAGLAELGLASALVRVGHGQCVIVWTSAPAELGERFLAITGRPLDGYVGRPNAFSAAVVRDGYAFSDDWGTDASGIVPEALAAALREAVQESGGTRAIGVRVDERDAGTRALIVAGDWVRSDDGPAVRLFGAQLAAAIDAARTVGDLSRRNAQLAVLNEVGRLASETEDIGAFFRRTVAAIRPIAGFSGCALFVADEPSETLVRIHCEGGSAELEALTARVPFASTFGDAMRDRVAHVVAVPFPGGDPAVMAAMPFRSLVLVPLMARSRAVGILAAGFEGGPDVARAAVEVLSAVGTHCASAIESHGLLSDLRRRVGELTLLVDVARASSQLDPAVLLDAALRRIAETLGADAALAYVRDGESLVLAASRGIEGDAAAVAELDPAAGDVGLAVRRLAPVAGRVRGAFAGRCARLGACGPDAALIVVPLLAKNEALGAVVLARAAGAPFSDGDAALLASMGVQLGLAVDAARLFSDVRRRLADLEAVHGFALRVHANTAGDVASLLQDGCRDVARALAARAAAVFLVSPDRSTLRLAASEGVPRAAAESAIDLSRDPFSAEVVRDRVSRVSGDVTRDPRSIFHGSTEVRPLAMLAVPLASRADVRGVLYVADAAGRRFSPGDVALANALAGALGIGVENAELYADARRRVEDLFLLNEVGRAVGGSLELSDVLRAAAEGARRLVHTSRAYVLLYDEARGEIRFGAGAGTDDAAMRDLRGPVPPGTVVERVLREKRPATVEDVARSDGGAVHRSRFGGTALAAVPVLLRGEALGVLVADEERGPRAFAEPDVERLNAVADRVAVAIENARLYLETRRRAEELAVLHEVGRSLVETLDIEQVLEGGVRNLARIVDVPDAYLTLASEDGRRLEVRAVTGSGEGRSSDLHLPLDADDSLASRAFARREPILVQDALHDPRVRRDLRERTGGRAYLALPLVVRDRAIGAAVIVETRGPRLFTPAEVERAAAIANQLAVAAENARLYEDLRRSYAQLARAQQQLIQGERLAALGELSAVVAHEVRNPLGVIFNSIGSLRRLLRPAGDAKMLFEIVEEEADRLNRIVGDLLDFARPSTPELRPEQLHRVVEDAVGAALGQQGSGIEVAREIDPAVPPVTMDARLVRQAVLNVAVNAIQAMPRGGRITIRTRREGAQALLEIEDTGAGIAEELRGRIFEPFFTTKASGTGLGLAVVKRIVEGHGGAVSVRSAPGGTVFALRFPLDGPPVENGPAMG
jgi:GAF domain-containing protein/two-component sensor histidine kinase